MTYFKKFLNKRLFFYLLIIFWVVFSVWYISFDFWNKFKTRELDGAYKKGSSDAVVNILKASDGCRVVSLFDIDGSESKFINISCLDNNKK